MIEISHQQARRLLRAAVYHPVGAAPLPQVQWSALQAHLEVCGECRAYQQELDAQEKGIRRSLHVGWSAVVGPQSQVDQEVLGQLSSRHTRRRSLLRLALLTAAVVLVLVWISRFAFNQPQPAAVVAELPTATPSPQPTTQPTIQPGEFDDVILFQSWKDGNSEIYLLNSGSQPVNLTNDPFEDTHPAWSPDGQWIAFLSDRTGKQEVFVLGLAGNRVVQLTHEPEIVWQGPLAWSPDGKWIGLTGLRTTQGSQPWVYLVPVEGGRSGSTRPIALEGSRDGWAPEFAGPLGRIAYVTWDGSRSGVVIYERDTGQRHHTYWDGGSKDRLQAGVALDWSPTGSGLAFLGGSQLGDLVGQDRSQVIAINTQPAVGPPDLEDRTQVAVSRWPVAFSSVTWGPGESVIYLQDLDDARANDAPGTTPDACWTLQVRLPQPATRMDGMELPNDLCVESGLDSTSWTHDQRWLVVRARRPGETQQAIYAVRIRGSQSARSGGQLDDATQAAEEAGMILRLTGSEHPFDQWSAELSGTLPRVRPRRPGLNINPYPVVITQQFSRTTDPKRASGEVIFSLNKNGVSVLARANPDGTGGYVLLANTDQNHCPVWSPDGQQILFETILAPSENQDATAPGESIYRMNKDGSGIERVVDAEMAQTTKVPSFIGCPVWSPDGLRMAVLAQAGEKHILVIAPTDASMGIAPVWYDVGRSYGGLAWTADSLYVVLPYQFSEGEYPQLLQVRAPEQTTRQGWAQILYNPFPNGFVYSLSASPDSSKLALLSSIDTPNNQRSLVLRLIRLSGESIHEEITLSEIPGKLTESPGNLQWLGDGNIGIILSGPGDGVYKNLILRYDPKRKQLDTLAMVEDRIYSTAWSPDGSWLIYSTESGLWLLDVRGAILSKLTPVWISPEPVFDLHWTE